MWIAKVLGFGLLGVVMCLCLVLGGLLGMAYLREAPQPLPEGRMLSTLQGEIFVQTWGPEDGPPVLLVHGTLAWSETWETTATRLAEKGWRVMAMDLPPFGYSQRIGVYDRTAQALRIVETAGYMHRPPIVVGHAFGAGPVMEAALSHPEAFDGVMVINAMLDIGEEASVLPLWLRPVFMREVLVAASMTNPMMTGRLLRGVVNDEAMVTDRWVEMLQDPLSLPGTTQAYAVWMKEMMAPTQTVSHSPLAYGSFPLPLAVLVSEHDAVVPRTQGEALVALVDGAALHTIPGLGHAPQIEGPIVFEDTLLAALDGLVAVIAQRALSVEETGFGFDR